MDYRFIDVAGSHGPERLLLLLTLQRLNLEHFDSELFPAVPLRQEPYPENERAPNRPNEGHCQSNKDQPQANEGRHQSNEDQPQAGLNSQNQEDLAQGGPTPNGAMNGPEKTSNCDSGPLENPLLSGGKPQSNPDKLNPLASIFQPTGIQQCQNKAQMPQAANPWTSAPNGSGVSYADRLKGMKSNGHQAWKLAQPSLSHQGRPQRMKGANGRSRHNGHSNDSGYNGHNGFHISAFPLPSQYQFSKEDKTKVTRCVYDFLSRQPLDPSVHYQLPKARGIINTGNHCFINSSLQALFTVKKFAVFMSGLSEAVREWKGEILERISPFAGALLCIWREYNCKTKKGPVQNNHIIEHLTLLRNPAITNGVQGDASEFLLCFLMKLQEELRNLKFGQEVATALTGAENGQVEEEEGWQQVKVGRRSGRRQILSDRHCPLASIFGGSVVYTGPGNVVEEPFFMQTVAIAGDDINTLDDAIRKHFAVEELSSGNQRKMTLCSLPDTLILTMKGIAVREDGTAEKIVKQLPITEWVHLQPDWLTDEMKEKVRQEKLTYRLTAAIFHAGQSFSSGHYWCYTRRSENTWTIQDDVKSYSVDLENILNYHKHGCSVVPHLLMFQLHSGR